MDCIGNEVRRVVRVIFVREVLFKMLGDVGSELLGSFKVVFKDEVLDESECFLKGGFFGFDFLDFEVKIVGDDIFELVFGFPEVTGSDLPGDFVEQFFGFVFIFEDLTNPMFEARLEVLIHTQIDKSKINNNLLPFSFYTRP